MISTNDLKFLKNGMKKLGLIKGDTANIYGIFKNIYISSFL